jgi:hypothetical protein
MMPREVREVVLPLTTIRSRKSRGDAVNKAGYQRRRKLKQAMKAAVASVRGQYRGFLHVGAVSLSPTVPLSPWEDLGYVVYQYRLYWRRFFPAIDCQELIVYEVDTLRTIGRYDPRLKVAIDTYLQAQGA